MCWRSKRWRKAKRDAEELAAAAKASGKLLAMGFNRCFYPNVAELRKRLKAGELGQITHAEGNFCVDRYRKVQAGTWKADPDQAPPGSLADHPLYLMIEMLGPVSEVYAVATTQVAKHIPLSDVTAVVLKFKSGQTGTLQANGVTPELSRLHVFGSSGWIEIRDQDYFQFMGLKGHPQALEIAEIDAERAEMGSLRRCGDGRRALSLFGGDGRQRCRRHRGDGEIGEKRQARNGGLV